MRSVSASDSRAAMIGVRKASWRGRFLATLCALTVFVVTAASQGELVLSQGPVIWCLLVAGDRVVVVGKAGMCGALGLLCGERALFSSSLLQMTRATPLKAASMVRALQLVVCVRACVCAIPNQSLCFSMFFYIPSHPIPSHPIPSHPKGLYVVLCSAV